MSNADALHWLMGTIVQANHNEVAAIVVDQKPDKTGKIRVELGGKLYLITIEKMEDGSDDAT